ncbi:hypothetical protein [Brenneria izbisi]|nr:hypothetical protein [Brenneria izbisi]
MSSIEESEQGGRLTDLSAIKNARRCLASEILSIVAEISPG